MDSAFDKGRYSFLVKFAQDETTVETTEDINTFRQSTSAVVHRIGRVHFSRIFSFKGPYNLYERSFCVQITLITQAYISFNCSFIQYKDENGRSKLDKGHLCSISFNRREVICMRAIQCFCSFPSHFSSSLSGKPLGKLLRFALLQPRLPLLFSLPVIIIIIIFLMRL